MGDIPSGDGRDLVSAVGAVADNVRRAEISACHDVAGVVRLHGADAVASLRVRFDTLKMRPVEPLELGWQPLAMLGRGQHEPSWTQWLTSLLRLGVAGDIAWRALVTVIRTAVETSNDPLVERSALLAALQKAAATMPRSEDVRVEDRTSDGGSVDLVLKHPDVLVVVENKLWAEWHDRPGNPQDVSYRAWANQIRGGRAVALVYLSAYDADEDVRRGRDGWLFVTWEHLGIALRRLLSENISENSVTLEHFAGLMPAFLTVAAIERDLYGLRRPKPPENGETWEDLADVTRVVRYLEAQDAD